MTLDSTEITKPLTHEDLPQIDPAFPLTFEELKQVYAGSKIVFEDRPSSFTSDFEEAFNEKGSLSAIEPELTIREAGTEFLRPTPGLLQRHFYWSASSYYRAFHLFLTYLRIDCTPSKSWGEVTAYYSRFYTTQAIMNLFLSHFVFVDKQLAESNKEASFLVYFGRDGARLRKRNEIAKALNAKGSHQIQWALFKQLTHVHDLPRENGSDVGLSELHFNPPNRNKVNYSENYLEGFPELAWFDTNLAGMQSHFAGYSRRADKDITSFDAYFEGCDPNEIDSSEFFGDEAQVVWLGLELYLKLISSLDINQMLITKEKLKHLVEVMLPNLPNLTRGFNRVINDTDLP